MGAIVQGRGLREVVVELEHSPTKLTYADYELFPDDDLRHEIIDGEHYVSAKNLQGRRSWSSKFFHPARDLATSG